MQNEINRAKSIAKSLGYYVAARYLAKRNWSLEAALWILLRTQVRPTSARTTIINSVLCKDEPILL